MAQDQFAIQSTKPMLAVITSSPACPVPSACPVLAARGTATTSAAHGPLECGSNHRSCHPLSKLCTRNRISEPKSRGGWSGAAPTPAAVQTAAGARPRQAGRSRLRLAGAPARRCARAPAGSAHLHVHAHEAEASNRAGGRRERKASAEGRGEGACTCVHMRAHMRVCSLTDVGWQLGSTHGRAVPAGLVDIAAA